MVAFSLSVCLLSRALGSLFGLFPIFVVDNNRAPPPPDTHVFYIVWAVRNVIYCASCGKVCDLQEAPTPHLCSAYLSNHCSCVGQYFCPFSRDRCVGLWAPPSFFGLCPIPCLAPILLDVWPLSCHPELSSTDLALP